MKKYLTDTPSSHSLGRRIFTRHGAIGVFFGALWMAGAFVARDYSEPIFLILFGLPFAVSISLILTIQKKITHYKNITFAELDAYAQGLDRYSIIARTDFRGKITDVNDTFCHLSGYTREELLGKNHRVINSGHHPKNFFKNLWDTINSGKIWQGEIKNKNKAGSYYWLDTTITPIVDSNGRIQEFISFSYNSTQKKSIEEQLRESETHHRVLFDQSRDALMTLDPSSWKFNSANPAALNLFGVESLADFCTLGPWDISPSHQPNGQNSSEAAKSWMEKAMQDGGCYFEWTHAKKDGTKVPCTVLLSRIEQGEKVYLQANVRDISQQKKIEKSLIESNESLETIITSLDDIITELSPQYTVLNLWTKDESHLFVPKKKIMGKDITLFLPPQIKSMLNNACKKISEGSQNELIEYQHPLNPEIWFQCKISKKTEHDPQSNLILVISDISKRKKLEIEQNVLVTQLNSFFDLTMNYQCIAKMNGYFIKINKTWENFGYEEKDFFEKPFIDFVHPDDQKATLHEIEKLSHGAPSIRFENRYRKKNGEYITLEWTTTPDTQSGLIYASAVDTTERNRSEEISKLVSKIKSKYIQLSSDKKKLFDFILSEILTLTGSEYGFLGEILEDKKGRFLRTFSMTDVSWDADTKKLYQESLTHGFEFRNLNTLFGEVIRSGAPLIANDPAHHPKRGGIPPGHPRLDSFAGIPVFHHDHFIAMIGLANKKNGYDFQLFERLAPLFEVIGEMIHSYRISRELEQQRHITIHNAKLASIGSLAAGVGHEINNPLTLIQSNMNFVKKHLISQKIYDDQLQSRLGKIEKSIHRITAIINGLRNLSRSDKNEFQSFNFSDLIHETIDMIQEIFEKENIKIQSKIESNLNLYGNRGQIQQVLVNLLTNAKDALEKTPEKQISITTATLQDKIEVIIQDNGCGIPTEIQEKIFEPFFTTKAINKGTGIGLTLISSIIKDHSGQISLKSQVGTGTQFTIHLPSQPLTQPPSTVSIHPAHHSPILPSTQLQGNVLVVDDEEGIREVLQDILQDFGLTVTTASSGAAALELIQNSTPPFDLVISDMKMPEMDGPTLLKKIRSLSMKIPPKFLFVTGGIHLDLSEYESLIDGVLSKPFNDAVIFKTLKNSLQKGSS